MDDDVSCSWQGQAIEALGFLAPAEEWHIVSGVNGVVCLFEDGENPGWLIWLDGQRIKLSWGCIDFESDVQRADIALSARWLMDAAAAWGKEEVRKVAQCPLFACPLFAMENKTYIYHNDHAGVWQWSVSYINDPENWLDSFPTLEEALDFCRDKNLTVASTLQDGREVSDE